LESVAHTLTEACRAEVLAAADEGLDADSIFIQNGHSSCANDQAG
jgi:hypothetical protein